MASCWGRFWVGGVALLAFCVIARSGVADQSDEVAAHFKEHVEPILVGRCLECHAASPKGRLDLRSKAGALAGGESGAAISPGDADGSLLFQYVESHTMPPPDSAGGPLNEEQIAALRKWIEDGAYLPDEPLDMFASSSDRRAGFDWWSLQPLSYEAPEPGAGAPPEWRASAIDRFVYARLAAQGLIASPAAGPSVLLRRATYDLTGLPPTPEEVAAFEAECLAETGADGAVGERAYERLVDRLLASDHYGEQWGRHWLDVVRFGESNGYERNVIHTTVWPFRDYVIRSLNEDKPFDRLIVEHLAGDVLAPNDPRVAVGTAFLVCGPYDDVGNQDPVAAAQIRADAIDEVIRASTEAFLGLTVGCSRCHDHKFDPISQRDYYAMYATFAGVRHGERAIGIANEGGEQAKEGSEATEPKTWWVGNYEQVNGPFHLFEGGSPQRRGEVVTPASLSTLRRAAGGYELAADSPEPQRRMALAEWITGEENPLTLRVLANRVWQHHFGTGIVETPSDFGFLGGRPTHPELLDWLACRLQEHGWRLKPLHKEIMLSQTYRQSSAYRAGAARVDADTRLLWRFPPRRLAAEEIRDRMLSVAGVLDLSMGGPGFRLFTYVQDNVATYYPLDEHGPETYRRAVYRHNARATQIDLLSEFDAPDCAFAAPRRSTTTTPLQALTLMNHSFTVDMAEALAERVQQERRDDTPAQVTRAFELALLREPAPEELSAALELIDAHGLRAFCRALLNTNEFIYID